MLSLYACNIGDQGACHLANALKNNIVKNKFFACLYILDSHLAQTLKILNLYLNQIGNEGLKYLSIALENNTVRVTVRILILIFLLQYRHSRR